VPIGASCRRTASAVLAAKQHLGASSVKVWRGVSRTQDAAGMDQIQCCKSVKESAYVRCTAEFTHKPYMPREGGLRLRSKHDGWCETVHGELVRADQNFRVFTCKRKKFALPARTFKEVSALPLHHTYSLQDGEFSAQTFLWKEVRMPTRLAAREALRLSNKPLVWVQDM
jgi:hypothetical protein